MLTFADLSAGVDVYSDWVDACDAVAQDAADLAAAEHIDHSHHGLAAEYGGKGSRFQLDQHLVPSLEVDDDSRDYDED